MNNGNEPKSFQYTYSAKEQAEVRSIREKYTAKEEDKMERLRRLDASATSKAQIISLVLGIVGTLVLGLGMSFALSDLADVLGSYREIAMPLGIIIGILGGIILGIAYPIYNLVLKRERERIAPEILRLTDEILK